MGEKRVWEKRERRAQKGAAEVRSKRSRPKKGSRRKRALSEDSSDKDKSPDETSRKSGRPRAG